MKRHWSEWALPVVTFAAIVIWTIAALITIERAGL